MQTFAIVVSLGITVVAVAISALAVRNMVGVVRMGQPAIDRTGDPATRTWTLIKESLGHTRMLQWHWVGIMHWFVYAAFLFLSTAVLAGYGQLFDPEFHLPIIGTWIVYEWTAELLGLLSTIGIVFLIVYRQVNHPRRKGRQSRFYRSRQWQAYFVEALVLLEGSAILFVRAAEYNLFGDGDRASFPISGALGEAFYPTSQTALENTIFFIAMFKITLAMIWLIVISANLTMGVAWHRFTAWPNIWFKRESSGRTALGAVKPITSDGKVVTLDDLDDLDEDSTLGVGKVEDFSWKGILDFTTCTECGRCQSQCPAWNTEKPLSPKLLIMGLRDHAYAKAPYARAGGEGSEAATALLEGDEALAREVERPLVGDTGDDWFYMPESGAAVIDDDVLWSCTSCGACVQQCPVDIEHVDHIIDMRRHQILVEANFPAELNQLFKGLENKGNPWNMSASARMEWAQGLDFDVPVVGEDVESLDEVEWLFWVGCAGAYEDRAKKTTRAVAELLNMAGVSFAVLGNGETCTGDPARRAGNEFVFQGLATQNAETFKEHKVKKVVSTCAHCFNTLKNEYAEFGVELEVTHHTQLLNRLVREGKLTPVKDGAGAAKRSITYHDPCYLGRHNQVYSPPRELLQILPGAEYQEMERHSEKSFCCGAGGARMWMEENIGERINLNRTKEAVGTGADQIAVGCPFCRVMLSDGLTSEQANGNAREEVEVLDVAQMLLASVKGESATRVRKSEKVAAGAASTTGAGDVATRAEPSPGDATQTEDTVSDPADVGPGAKASSNGGGSLFDTPAEEKPAAKASPDSGGSLFDTPADPPAEEKPAAQASPDTGGSGGSLFDVAPTETAEEKPAQSEAKPDSGGSLFDVAPTEAAEEKPAQSEAKPSEPKPTETEAAPAPAETATADLSSGGSLFDLAAPEPESAQPEADPEPDPEPEAKTATETTTEASAAEPQPQAAAPAVDLDGGSLFDIAAPTPADDPAPEAEAAVEAAVEPEEPTEPVAATQAPDAEEAPQVEEAPSLADGGQALSDAATEAASSAPESEGGTLAAESAEPEEPEAQEPETEQQKTEEPETEQQETERPKPAASDGPAHQPRTDADVHGSGSLFDL